LSEPAALTVAEAADVLSRASGASSDLPLAQRVEGAEANGLPLAYAVVLGELLDVIRGGHDAYLGHVSFPSSSGHRRARPWTPHPARGPC
jgi:hypothetical protein